MTEYVYKLNLPQITDILKEGVSEKLFVGALKPIHKSYKAEDVIKPEWMQFKNITWSELILFYKPDFVGTIHADDQARIRTLDDNCVWGINWIYNGTGIMEYWEHEDMRVLDIVKDSVGTANIRCETDLPARKVYKTEPGPYLVNASMIHRVTGYGPRYAVCLRSNNAVKFKWNQLVDTFRDCII